MTVHASVPDAAAALPAWRLDDLYSGRDDPRLESDLKTAQALAADLSRLKGQFVAARGNAERLGLLLAEGVGLYEKITNLLGSAGAFAALAASTARDGPAWAKLEGALRAKSSAVAAETLFLTLEINQLEEWEVEAALKAAPDAARWRPW